MDQNDKAAAALAEKRHDEIIKDLCKIADNIGAVKTEVETLRHAINEAVKRQPARLG